METPEQMRDTITQQQRVIEKQKEVIKKLTKVIHDITADASIINSITETPPSSPQSSKASFPDDGSSLWETESGDEEDARNSSHQEYKSLETPPPSPPPANLSSANARQDIGPHSRGPPTKVYTANRTNQLAGAAVPEPTSPSSSKSHSVVPGHSTPVTEYSQVSSLYPSLSSLNLQLSEQRPSPRPRIPRAYHQKDYKSTYNKKIQQSSQETDQSKILSSDDDSEDEEFFDTLRAAPEQTKVVKKPKAPPALPDDRSATCPGCHRIFKNWHGRRVHQGKMGCGMEREPSGPKPSLQVDDRSPTCPGCQRTFKNWHGRRTHQGKMNCY